MLLLAAGIVCCLGWATSSWANKFEVSDGFNETIQEIGFKCSGKRWVVKGRCRAESSDAIDRINYWIGI